MKSYRRFVGWVFAFVILVFAVSNIWMIKQLNMEEERTYMVEVSRLVNQMEAAGFDAQTDLSKEITLKECQYVKRVILCDSNEALTESSPYESCVREVNGSLYRFFYQRGRQMHFLLFLNVILIGISALLALVLLYVGRKIILPFHKIEEIPYELSKGNLSLELPEEKTRYFGRFIWGINMLRENLEERRKKELFMHREKKLLLLSLTHDIKTPLSVIKLNAQALEKNLYKEEKRRQKAAKDIHAKVDEIENYVTEIVAASRDEFLDLSVVQEDFYLGDVVKKITEYYRAKLELKRTEFQVEDYHNCLLSGDENRLLEVLQNLFENAIKYGDGQKICLSFERDQGYQLITVQNTLEKAMKPEEIIKIFDSFYRGSNVGNQDGSGLGLYICRQLMNNMNGDIFAKQTEGCFQVTVVVRVS